MRVAPNARCLDRILTDSLLYLICSDFRRAFSFATFSALCASSLSCCCLAFSACRLSISCRLFCWPLGVLWLNVLRSPPNNRRPRFLSSCTLLLRLSEACSLSFTSSVAIEDSGLALPFCGDTMKDVESAFSSTENLGRFKSALETEDCLRLRGGLCPTGSGRMTAEEIGLRLN
jgi:hypothetical protein